MMLILLNCRDYLTIYFAFSQQLTFTHFQRKIQFPMDTKLTTIKQELERRFALTARHVNTSVLCELVRSEVKVDC